MAPLKCALICHYRLTHCLAVCPCRSASLDALSRTVPEHSVWYCFTLCYCWNIHCSFVYKLLLLNDSSTLQRIVIVDHHAQ